MTMATKYLDYSTFGGGAIERELFDYIRSILPDGSTILEFGSGYGTDQLLKHYNVISIEHDPEYHKQRPERHKAYLAALVDGWYDPEVVKTAMEDHFDLILVDGPPHGGRAGLLNHIDLFKDIRCQIIFDDVDRVIDHDTMLTFCRERGYKYEIIAGEEKRFAYCYKIACFTVITGNYDTLMPPKRTSPGIDYICITDNPELRSDIWEIKVIPTESDKVKQQRRIKCWPYNILGDYGLTIYVDGNQQIKEDILGILEFYHGGFMTKKHPVRGTIQEEAEAVIKRKKAMPGNIMQQMEAYRDIPTDGLYETGCIIRDHDVKTMALCREWLRHIDAYTHRDQLSLPVAAHVQGVEIKRYGLTLHERYFHKVPHSSNRIFGVSIFYSTPFATDKNIGREYNRICSVVPDGSWICLRDGDSMFTTDFWGKQIEDILAAQGGNYDLFGCVTNRLSDSRQCPFPELFDESDYNHHKNIGLSLYKTKYTVVTPATKPIAGLFLLFHKDVWTRFPFKENDHQFDTDFGSRILQAGLKIGVCEGLYLFHDYRWGKENPRKYVKHLVL